MVQIISMLLFAARDRFHWPVLAAAIPIFLCYGVLGWYSYESPLALLPVIASLIGMLPFFQSKEAVIKIAAIISDSLAHLHHRRPLLLRCADQRPPDRDHLRVAVGGTETGQRKVNEKNGLPRKSVFSISAVSQTLCFFFSL